MTATPSSFTRTKQQGPLHFLALVALDAEKHPYDCNVDPVLLGEGLQNVASPSYETPPYTVSSTATHSVSSLHISCGRTPSDAGSDPQPLIQSAASNATNSSQGTEPLQSKHPMRTRRKCHRRESPLLIKAKEETLARRRERLERATKIRSLDNSPVNDEQLTVLRMVYDEITMYPSESWMVLIAIIIRRSFKQVKNWFSNERQKNRTGDMISVCTEEGDKMRLRAPAIQFSEHWSDSILEEVAMVYHFLVTQNFRRRKRRLTVQREPLRVMELHGQNSRSL